VSAWWWVLAALVAAAIAVAVVLLVRSRRARTAWQARYDAGVSESTWLAHDLMPDALSATDPAARRATWQASRPRVETLQRALDDVVAGSPEDRQQASGRLRDAVGGVAAAMDADAAATADDGTTLGAAQQAHRQLEQSLRALQPPPDTPPGTTPPTATEG
jgi:hypothetical protein